MVYGHAAIVAAIDQRVTVTLVPRTDRRVVIQSDIAPQLEGCLDKLSIDGVYRFVLAAIACHVSAIPTGFELFITSDINPTLGLGSSAAVTIATLGALTRLADKDTSALHADALAIVRKLQGRGSGADLAASLSGGMISYRAPIAEAEAQIAPLPLPEPQLSLKYSGYKTPTADVLARIAQGARGKEAEYDALYARMGQAAEKAISTAQVQDWEGFALWLNAYQELMAVLGVSDAPLERIIREARAAPQTRAAKISGSGLGDCVLALGPPPSGFEDVRIASEGLRVDG